MGRQRVFLIVLDSFGIGNAPDAADFGDEGANTLHTITQSPEYDTPNMNKLGLSLSLIHISEPTRHRRRSRMPSSA